MDLIILKQGQADDKNPLYLCDKPVVWRKK